MLSQLQQLKLTGDAHGAAHQGIKQIVVLVEHGPVGGIENQLQGIGGGLVTAPLGLDTPLNGICVGLRGRHIPAAIPIQGHLVGIVACHIPVSDRPILRGFLPIAWNGAVYSSVCQGAGASSDHDLQLFGEHHIIRDGHIVYSLEEGKDLRGNVLRHQSGGVTVFPLIVVGLSFGIQIGGGQLSIGHIQRPGVRDVLLSAQSDLVLQIVLPQREQLIGGEHIMLAIEDHLIKFLLGERMIDVEVNRCLPDVHTQVSFDGLQTQAHLAIIHQVKAVKEHLVLLEEGVLPSVVTVNDDEVIDGLDHNRVSITQDGLQDVVVVVLVVEATEDRVLIHELFDGIVVIVDDRVLSGLPVHKHEQPVIGKDLTVENIDHRLILPAAVPAAFSEGLPPHPPSCRGYRGGPSHCPRACTQRHPCEEPWNTSHPASPEALHTQRG